MKSFTAFHSSIPLTLAKFQPPLKALTSGEQRRPIFAKRQRTRATSIQLTANPISSEQDPSLSSNATKSQELSNSIARELPPYEGFEEFFPPGSKLVSVPLPLGVYLEEAEDGVVYVDEVAEEGNAAQHGLLPVGSAVLAVSIPYGDAVLPIPNEEGLSMVETQISTRGENEKDFRMVLLPKEKRSPTKEVKKGPLPEMSFEEMKELSGKFFADGYIVVEDTEEEGRSLEADLQALKEYGFDV